VLREIDNATKAFPNAYIRMCAFDANRQVQVASMLVHRPSSAKEWKPVNQRQVGGTTAAGGGDGCCCLDMSAAVDGIVQLAWHQYSVSACYVNRLMTASAALFCVDSQCSLIMS
jgi:hypothetical protein